jgi:signal peptidase II
MIYLFLALLVASLDMATKAMTLNFIDFGQHIDIISGIVGLTATKNTGIAFSMFSDSGWILTAIIGVLVLILAVMMLAGKGFTGFERICLALILGGAIGNLLDRLIYGYVLDMIEVLFVDFAVFNLADSCITVGCILFAVHLLFFHGKAELAREEQRQRELEQMRRTMGDEEEAEKAAAREAAAKLTAAAEEAEKAARSASQAAIKPVEDENK